MLEVSHKELDSILVQIDQAIDNHDQWYDQLMRTLICKLPPDQRDLEEEAHKLCRFGQWYYQSSDPALRSHPTFAAIENEHKQLHGMVSKLLQISTVEEQKIDVKAFDQFANTLERMRLQLFSLKHEIEDDLNNLDPLTGTYNRYGMLAILREQQELVARGVNSCSLAMLDIDFFKQVNDQYGHRMGDKTLANIASILLKGLRPYDKLFRYGGEEFVIMFPNTPVEMALLVAERMRKNVEDAPIEIDKLPIRVTVSIGIAAIDANASVESSISKSDAAMYAAKESGRNQVKLWEASMPGK
ncbi:MAG TPA: diguanylate cyclase [Mariprofundaceae bacterium]|nr:diguanylate cyclase [Mariprofundaceae bacterium]